MDESNINRIHLVKGNKSESVANDRKMNPFKWIILDKISAGNFWSMFMKDRNTISVEDINELCGEDGAGVNFKEIEPEGDRNDVVYFSSNGFTLQLNKKEMRYALLNPQSECDKSKGEDWLSYDEGKKMLEERATEYQAQQLAEFGAGIKN
ncbi:MAG: hypothetical protein P4L63_02810 [Candidatus Pacebacteria bacterium]|nr:hypothetical protein [Candidatus Paceibacterota bacterium]